MLVTALEWARRGWVVIQVNGIVVHWASHRQSMTMSSCESEIVAHVTGFKLMIGIRDLIEEATVS